MRSSWIQTDPWCRNERIRALVSILGDSRLNDSVLLRVSTVMLSLLINIIKLLVFICFFSVLDLATLLMDVGSFSCKVWLD